MRRRAFLAVVGAAAAGSSGLAVAREQCTRRTRVGASKRPRQAVKVIGVGGLGGKVVSGLAKSSDFAAQFITVDTSLNDLSANKSTSRIQVGSNLVHGLGCCGRLDVAKRAIRESETVLARALEGAVLVILVAALGRGFGSVAAPWLAARNRERGVRTVAIVSRPFTLEGRKCSRIAAAAVKEITCQADMTRQVDGDSVLARLPGGFASPRAEAMALLDEVIAARVRAFLEDQ